MVYAEKPTAQTLKVWFLYTLPELFPEKMKAAPRPLHHRLAQKHWDQPSPPHRGLQMTQAIKVSSHELAWNTRPEPFFPWTRLLSDAAGWTGILGKQLKPISLQSLLTQPVYNADSHSTWQRYTEYKQLWYWEQFWLYYHIRHRGNIQHIQLLLTSGTLPGSEWFCMNMFYYQHLLWSLMSHDGLAAALVESCTLTSFWVFYTILGFYFTTFQSTFYFF